MTEGTCNSIHVGGREGGRKKWKNKVQDMGECTLYLCSFRHHTHIIHTLKKLYRVHSSTNDFISSQNKYLCKKNSVLCGSRGHINILYMPAGPGALHAFPHLLCHPFSPQGINRTNAGSYI